MSNSGEEKKWLVKDHHQIIGPFTSSELKAELAKGSISPVATVCIPNQEFWAFVAAYSEFTGYTDITKLTSTYNFSTIRVTSPDQLLEQANQWKKGHSSSPAKEVSYDVIEEKPELQPSKVERKPKGNLFLIAGVAFLCFIVGVFYMSAYTKNKWQPSSSTLDSEKIGRVYFSVGNYAEAFRIWTEANNLNKYDELLFRILKFQLNNDLSQAPAIIKSNTHKAIDFSDMKQMIQALEHLKTDNLSSAEQGFAWLAYNSQSQNIRQSAFANLALVSSRARKCDFINKYKEEDFGNRNLIYFSCALCLLQSDSLTADQKNTTKNFLMKITQIPQDYYQEALLGLAYIQSTEGGEEVLPSIKNLLDSDPYLTEDHYYDVFIDRKTYSWPQLLPLCESIYSTNKDHKLFITFYAYCLIRSHRHEMAKNFIEKASLIDSKDVLIKTIHAYITDVVNFKSQSVLILGDAIQSNLDMTYTLPYILQARFCEQNKNWKCALQNWRLVLNNTPNSFSGLGGVAYSKYNQGQYEEAEIYVNRGFDVNADTHYSPLLFVKKMLKENKQQ